MAQEKYHTPTDFVNPEDIYESYEDLFQDEDSNSRPCYLPEESSNDVIEQGIYEENDIKFSADRNGNCSPEIALDGDQIAFNDQHIALSEGHPGIGSGEGINKEEENLDIETPISLSSRGYAAGTGSSNNASSLESIIGDEIIGKLCNSNGEHGNRAKWVPGKRHGNESPNLICRTCVMLKKYMINMCKHNTLGWDPLADQESHSSVPSGIAYVQNDFPASQLGIHNVLPSYHLYGSHSLRTRVLCSISQD
eukprot:Gb_14921 [translate_table: standard]